MDRNTGPGDCQRRHLRSGGGAAGRQQALRAPPDHRAQRRPRIGILPQMRLCAVADVSPHLRAQNPLLSLPRLRRLAPSRRAGVRQPADPPRPARPDRVAGSIHLIEDPTLIRAELDRRLDAARAAEPTKRRREALERELTRIRKSMERLLTAYQEDLLPLDELRRRMPELRAREQSVRA